MRGSLGLNDTWPRGRIRLKASLAFLGSKNIMIAYHKGDYTSITC